MAGRTTITGIDTLNRRLKQIADGMGGRGLEDALQAAADVVRDAARDRAPRAQGQLAENIETDVVMSGADEAEIAIGPTPEAFYGMFQELGTSRHAAQPFLRPAMDENESRAVDAFRDELRKPLRRFL